MAKVTIRDAGPDDPIYNGGFVVSSRPSNKGEGHTGTALPVERHDATTARPVPDAKDGLKPSPANSKVEEK